LLSIWSIASKSDRLFSGTCEDAVIQSRRRRPALLATILLLVLGDVALLGTLATRARPVLANDPDAALREVMTVLHHQGLAASLDTLEQWAARDSAVLRDGHQMAHALGRQAVADRGGDAAVIRQCRPAFASGCYHGVVEATLRDGGRIDMSRLQRLCLETERASGPGPGYECVHGLGHGIVGAVDYDIHAALLFCDALSTSSLRTSCHSGAFMEAITTALGAPAAAGMAGHAHVAEHQHSPAGSQRTPSDRRLSIDPADPYSPCDGFDDPYASSCWLFQGFVILRHNGFDASRAFHVCEAAPAGRAARCYQSIGHQLTGLFQHDDRWIVDQCSRGRGYQAPECAAGAALALDALDWSGNRAVRLCASAPADWKDACYRSASAALVDLAPPSRRAQLCERIEAAYAKACREASRPAPS
jgi:hypothetical protein